MRSVPTLPHSGQAKLHALPVCGTTLLDSGAALAQGQRSAIHGTRSDTALASERRPDFVDSLAKGLQLLATFEHDQALSNGELVLLTGLPKATVSRLTGTLVSLGYLQRDGDSRKYRIGARALSRGNNLQRHARLQRAARPLMRQLADTLGLTVALGMREGTRVLLLEKARAPHCRMAVDSDVGTHIPMATTALGMGLLVATPVRERVRLLDELQRHHAAGWNPVRERIERAHAEHERQRFIVSTQSACGPIASAAVPLVVDGGRVFALAAVGPVDELTRSRLVGVVGPAVCQMVDAIAAELNGADAAPALGQHTRIGDLLAS